MLMECMQSQFQFGPADMSLVVATCPERQANMTCTCIFAKEEDCAEPGVPSFHPQRSSKDSVGRAFKMIYRRRDRDIP